jgi:uncharacterized protein (DUF362 family)
MKQVRKVHVSTRRADLRASLRRAMEGAGILGRVGSTTRVALKPNLTYPYHRPGVTTSPEVVREVVGILKERTDRIAIVETDGGYGAWRAEAAFEGHGFYELQRLYGIDVVNLCKEESIDIQFRRRFSTCRLPLPKRLLEDTDLFITMPVPKVHAMTTLTLAYKNQWGCIPDIMRLRRHYLIGEALVAINQALRPAVIGDGTYFLDVNGPMEGSPRKMDLLIGASDAGAFDRYVSELMRIDWKNVPHLRAAVRCGDMPGALDDIEFNQQPSAVSSHQFTLARTTRNMIALAGFHSRFLTWFGYESWFGKVILHGILYAIVGRPVKPQPTQN